MSEASCECSTWLLVWEKTVMPADEHILILQQYGPGKRVHSRMIEEASDVKGEIVMLDRSVLSMSKSFGNDQLV
jgi:hypothetical protein